MITDPETDPAPFTERNTALVKCDINKQFFCNCIVTVIFHLFNRLAFANACEVKESLGKSKIYMKNYLNMKIQPYRRWQNIGFVLYSHYVPDGSDSCSPPV